MLYQEKFTIAGALKKLREINHRGKKQPPFDFDKKDHQNILKEIKKELKAIREILG